MKYFGPKKWGHFEEPTEVPTPSGMKCIYCDEEIATEDFGVLMPFISMEGEETEVAQHRECLLRAVIGSVGHLMKRCSCYGGTEEDPPNMTKRQAAKAATELMSSLQRLDVQPGEV